MEEGGEFCSRNWRNRRGGAGERRKKEGTLGNGEISESVPVLKGRGTGPSGSRHQIVCTVGS
jgi:hypothetical protein